MRPPSREGIIKEIPPAQQISQTKQEQIKKQQEVISKVESDLSQAKQQLNKVESDWTTYVERQKLQDEPTGASQNRSYLEARSKAEAKVRALNQALKISQQGLVSYQDVQAYVGSEVKYEEKLSRYGRQEEQARIQYETSRQQRVEQLGLQPLTDPSGKQVTYDTPKYPSVKQQKIIESAYKQLEDPRVQKVIPESELEPIIFLGGKRDVKETRDTRWAESLIASPTSRATVEEYKPTTPSGFGLGFFNRFVGQDKAKLTRTEAAQLAKDINKYNINIKLSELVNMDYFELENLKQEIEKKKHPDLDPYLGGSLTSASQRLQNDIVREIENQLTPEYQEKIRKEILKASRKAVGR